MKEMYPTGYMNTSERGEIRQKGDRDVSERGWKCIREGIWMYPRRDKDVSERG